MRETSHMTVAVAVFGLLIFGVGMLGLVQPLALISLVERPWRSHTGLYLAITFRAVLGVLLVAAASETRFPWILRALGVLSLITAVLIPVLGYARLRSFVDWWSARPEGFIRAWCFVACAFGGFLIYAAV